MISNLFHSTLPGPIFSEWLCHNFVTVPSSQEKEDAPRPGPWHLSRRLRCNDPDDDVILAYAATAKVDYLVSGDKDLLELKTFRGVRIVPPKGLECLFPG